VWEHTSWAFGGLTQKTKREAGKIFRSSRLAAPETGLSNIGRAVESLEPTIPSVEHDRGKYRTALVQSIPA